MEIYYTILIGLLLLFGFFDLIVGVSNDAVNFLNSAIGSKAAPFWIITSVASLGIIIGATFSNGMMEVARNGIFDPSQFYFREIIILFLAVMFTDIILLDTFNTLGFPTSTTISLIFGVLGAATSVALLKQYYNHQSIANVIDYINTENAFIFVNGILLSVALSLVLGAIVQWIARFIFSFNYTKSLKYGGSLFGALVITTIIYFLFIQGANGASFMNAQLHTTIVDNTYTILIISLVFWATILQLTQWIFKIDILKICVLIGTFSLAMAFAGNDLVNFIGIPLAGFEAFKAYIASGMNDQLTMSSLNNSIPTPTIYLLIAGMIMVLTLWFSKKAKTVTATELNLSNQGEQYEQFGSSMFARSIVRGAITFRTRIESMLPDSINYRISKQFEHSGSYSHTTDAPSFDMLRATISLLVASILISVGTSFQLPLSTTYVTFMVAMGTSLADGAWNRESAVYRVTGVIAVIGGWFITAFAAFIISALIAFIIYQGGAYGIIVLLVIMCFIIVKQRIAHIKKRKEKEKIAEEIRASENIDITTRCESNIQRTLSEASILMKDTIEALCEEDRIKLRETHKKIAELNQEVKDFKNNLSTTIRKMNEVSVESGHYYVQMLDYLREVAHCLTYINNPAYEHINNNHKPLHLHQITELAEIKSHIVDLLFEVMSEIENHDFSIIDDIVAKQEIILDIINSIHKKQIKRIKRAEVNTRNSMLYLSLLHELKSLSLYTVNILKSHRDFVTKGLIEQ